MNIVPKPFGHSENLIPISKGKDQVKPNVLSDNILKIQEQQSKNIKTQQTSSETEKSFTASTTLPKKSDPMKTNKIAEEIKGPSKKIWKPEDFQEGVKVGRSVIKHMENEKWKEVEVTLVVGEVGSEIVFLAKDAQDRTLGHIRLEVQSSEGANTYPGSQKNQKFIFVHGIDSKSKDAYQNVYKGVGTVLMQLAFEYGKLHGCEGRIKLDSIDDSQPFYLDEFHMKSIDEETEAKLNKVMAQLPHKKNWEIEKQKQIINFYESLLDDAMDLSEREDRLKNNLTKYVEDLSTKYEKLPERQKAIKAFLNELPEILENLSPNNLLLLDPNATKKIKKKIKEEQEKLKILEKLPPSKNRGLFTLYLSKEEIPRLEARYKANPILK